MSYNTHFYAFSHAFYTVFDSIAYNVTGRANGCLKIITKTVWSIVTKTYRLIDNNDQYIYKNTYNLGFDLFERCETRWGRTMRYRSIEKSTWKYRCIEQLNICRLNNVIEFTSWIDFYVPRFCSMCVWVNTWRNNNVFDILKRAVRRGYIVVWKRSCIVAPTTKKLQ